MTVEILTVFPEMFESVFASSILGRAREQSLQAPKTCFNVVDAGFGLSAVAFGHFVSSFLNLNARFVGTTVLPAAERNSRRASASFSSMNLTRSAFILGIAHPDSQRWLMSSRCGHVSQ